MKYRVFWLTTAVSIVLAFIATGCGHFDKTVYDKAFSSLQESAVYYGAEGKHEEVVYITRALLDAEPANQEVLKLQKDAVAARPATAVLLHKSILGSNLTDRVTNESFPLWGKLVLYLPNRLFDVMDLITLEVGFCFGLGVKGQVTDFAAVGFQASGGEATIGCNGRHLAAAVGFEEYIHLLPVGASILGETRASTSGSYGIMSGQAGVKLPADQRYRRVRDFWAVGVQTEAAVVAARTEIHPIELYDLFAGFVLFDPLRDDVGSTKPMYIELTGRERKLLKDLARQLSVR